MDTQTLNAFYPTKCTVSYQESDTPEVKPKVSAIEPLNETVSFAQA